jgi:hypothetical protein
LLGRKLIKGNQHINEKFEGDLRFCKNGEAVVISITLEVFIGFRPGLKDQVRFLNINELLRFADIPSDNPSQNSSLKEK